MARSFYLFLIILAIGSPLAALTQQPTNPDPANYTQAITILPPTPNAASLGKYGGVHVNLSQGSLDLPISLYDFASTILHLPISLSYNSSSIKVDEIGSNVGMSWALNCGGVVARTVYGTPDGFVARASAPTTFPAQNDSLLYFLANVTTDNTGRSNFDGQPDLFSFNFDGNTGKFVLDSTLLNAVLLTYSGVKIESHVGASDTTWHFRITTLDGVQYYFGGNSAIDKSSSQQIGTDVGRPYPIPAPTAYYLTKIVHPDGDSIWFTYSPNNFTYKYSINEEFIGATSIGGTSACEVTYAPLPNIQVPNPTSYTQISSTGYLLTQINSAGGASAVLHYVARQDGLGQLLSGIDFYAPGKSAILKSYSLGYTYATSTAYANTYTDTSCTRRPFLTNLTENSGDSTQQLFYQFKYNNINGLPPRLSYAQDHFGFFNGKANTTLVPPSAFSAYTAYFPYATANRNVDTSYSLTGLLTNIVYPTGGQDSIDYEPNYVWGSVTGATPTATVNEAAIGGHTNSVTDTLVPTITQDVTVFVACSYIGSPSRYDPEHDIGSATVIDNGTFIYQQTIPSGSGYNKVIQLVAGHTYTFNIQANFDSVEASLVFTYVTGAAPVTSQNVATGGNRVKRVTSIDPVANNTNIKRYYYNKPGSIDTSSAISLYAPRYDKTARYFVPCSDYPESQNEYDYAALYATTQCNLYEYGGFPVSYSAVTESFGENFDNGGIEHDFTQVADQPGNPLIGDFLLNAPRTSYSWLNGKEYFSSQFKNVSGILTPLKQTYTHFTQDARENAVVNAYQTSRLYYARVTYEPPIASQFDAYDLTVYSFLQAWLYPDMVINITYDQNGANPHNDTVMTAYKNPVHALPTQTISSESDFRSQLVNYSYPSDTTFSGAPETARQQLVAQHILAPPLITTELRGTDTMFVERTDYGVFASGQALPQLHNLKVRNNTLEPRLQLYAYNNNAKLLEQAKVNDAHTSYIWDYMSMYPIAQVTNATQSDIAYTSFEADGTGNWTLGSGTVDSTTAVTGHRSYNLTGSITKPGLTSSNTYIVSYWTLAGSGAFSIAGTISGYPMQGKTVTVNNVSWTLYVHKVTGQSTITVSGNGHIDELRLYPATAQMTTYTYDPLVGMTTQTDAGNRATYYQYDGLARLIRIRDQDYNILKTLDYQYQAPAGCGSGCYAVTMQTFAGGNTLSYPVGVFDVNGKLLGNVSNATAYISAWNSDTADNRLGTLAAGTDSMHFNLTLNAGQTMPAGVIGCRYYQWDLPWTNIDGFMYNSGSYVDFGDGTGSKMPKSASDTVGVGSNTTRLVNGYLVHTYADSSLKTITIYHNDGTETIGLDNANDPATSLTKVRHLRGNFPQHALFGKFSSMHQPSALTMDSIWNWNSITSINSFALSTGDGGLNACENLNYAQDFMKNNKGLQALSTSYGGYGSSGVRDTTFKLTLFKPDWNTYFTSLQDLQIVDDHWNREDLSALTNLNFVYISAGNHDGLGSYIPIPYQAVDNIINQIAAGAGPNVSNGTIGIWSYGGGRSAASNASVNFLLSKGWKIGLDGVLLGPQ